MDENALPLEEQHEGDSFVEAFAEGLAFPEEDGDLPQVFEESGMRDMGEMEDAFAMPESVAPLLSTQMATQETEESVGGKCGVIAVLRTRAAAPTPRSRGKVQATRYTDLLEESRGMEVALIQEEGARGGVRKGRQRAAQLFYELLQLASKDSITVRQDAPFSEIEIKGKVRSFDGWAQSLYSIEHIDITSLSSIGGTSHRRCLYGVRRVLRLERSFGQDQGSRV
jgi:hypothetical protein